MYHSENLPQLKLPASPQPPAPNDPRKTQRIATPRSKWLSLLEYDPSTLRLTVHFKSGAVIQHLYVYPQEWEKFQFASSKGSHYARTIKNSHASVPIQNVIRKSDFPKRRKE